MLDERDLGETQILAALVGVSEMIGSLPDINEVLRMVVRIAPQLVKVDRCAIFRFEEGTQELVSLEVFAYEEAKASVLKGLRLRLADIPRLASKVAKQKLPALVRDVPQDDILPEEMVRRLGIRSLLAVPLIAKGEFRGMMTLDHTQARHYFTSKEINVTLGLADQVALAMENYRISQELGQVRRSFEAAVESLSDGLITLGEDFMVDELNSRGRELLGLAEIVGRIPWHQLLTFETEEGKPFAEEDLLALMPKEPGVLSEGRRVYVTAKGGRKIACAIRVLAMGRTPLRINRLILVLRRIAVRKGIAVPPAAAKPPPPPLEAGPQKS